MYFDVWREDLAAILGKFETWRISTNFFPLKVFIFFVLINDLAYWFAIATAYSEIFATEKELIYYSKIQFPVALLGALFCFEHRSSLSPPATTAETHKRTTFRLLN